MKKTILISLLMLTNLFAACVTTTTSVSASASLSNSKVRNHARYLTDRMAYELDFTPMQYDDCYEINYDFIRQASYLMNDIVHGYYDAINTYYRYLDWRNEDLRYIMSTSQYIRFLSKDYFYRPIYSTGSSWGFRIYTIYSNSSFFYYDAPTVFKTYSGGHSRSAYSNGFYNNRYTGASHYTGRGNILGSNNFNEHRKNDFGTNLRNRNANPDYNNYNNRNSNNRTSDPRYRDTSGNRNTPEINNRTTTPQTTTTPARTSRTEVVNSRTGTTTTETSRGGTTTGTSTGTTTSRGGTATGTSTTTGRSSGTTGSTSTSRRGSR